MRQSTEAEVDVPVNMQRQAPPVFRMGVQLHGFVVDVPVIMQRRPAVPQISLWTEFMTILRRADGNFCRILRHFSASVHLDVEAHGEPSTTNSCCLSRAGGGGDAGSLSPRCSATLIRCIFAVVQPPQTTTNHHTPTPTSHHHPHTTTHHHNNHHNHHNTSTLKRALSVVSFVRTVEVGQWLTLWEE